MNTKSIFNADNFRMAIFLLTLIGSTWGTMWTFSSRLEDKLTRRIDRLEDKIDTRFDKIETRLNSFGERIARNETRLDALK